MSGEFMSIKFDMNILNKDFPAKCKYAIKKRVYERMKAVSAKVRPMVIIHFEAALRRNPIYKALCDPMNLGGDLGVYSHQVDYVVDFASKAISVTTKPLTITKETLGGINVVLLKQDINFFTTHPYGKYLTERGREIPWLEWLLTRGDDYIVETLLYDTMTFEEGHEKSRTGFKIMVKRNSTSFSIDPFYAGTINDNWFTQSARDAMPDIISTINKELVRRNL